MQTILTIAGALLLASCASAVFGQAEISGWGNLRGIRVDGELVPITTSIVIASPGWTESAESQHWRTRKSTYERVNGAIVSGGEIAIARGPALKFKQIVTDSAPGSATIAIECTAEGDLDLEGVYVFVKVPADQFAAGEGELIPAGGSASFATTRSAADKHYLGGIKTAARFIAPGREVLVSFDRPLEVVFQDGRADGERCITLFARLHDGDLKARQTIRSTLKLRTTGEADRSPAMVTIDAGKPGATFEGLGGNFCWGTQSPTVSYYLDNARLAWARVSFPMQVWQPNEDEHPTTRPIDTQPDEIRECLRMARELHRRGIPIMLSIWNVPDWAIQPRQDSELASRRAVKIDPEKWPAVAESIGRYLLLFKQHVGVEPAMFSFNESNLGINVLMSPDEHRDMLKILGAHFRSIGLKTQMLLGDANEPRAVEYVNAALADAEAMKYVGLVSYHSWNGGTDEQLIGWRDHARRAGVPLTVAEAGNDPDAHQYRAVLTEPWYALEEIENYLRCMTLSQPASLLHWQLTPDYGFVSEQLEPTRRWWQFKQLADLTPSGSKYLPTSCDRRQLTVVALAGMAGDGDVSVVHIANSGVARNVVMRGLPRAPTTLRMFITDGSRQLMHTGSVETRDGRAEITLPAQSFVTLVR